jgi:hypothetical protein
MKEKKKLMLMLMYFFSFFLSKGLEDAGLFDGAAVLIEIGKPMKVDEFQVKFFLYDMEKIEPWTLISSTVVSENSTVLAIKESLQEAVGTPVELIRLREKGGARPGKVLFNNFFFF